jgi:hypothetical protein
VDGNGPAARQNLVPCDPLVPLQQGGPVEHPDDVFSLRHDGIADIREAFAMLRRRERIAMSPMMVVPRKSRSRSPSAMLHGLSSSLLIGISLQRVAFFMALGGPLRRGFICPQKNHEVISGPIRWERKMKLGALLVIGGIIALLIYPVIGVVLIVIGVGLLVIAATPKDYDEEEQLETEDEINFIYCDE